MDILSISKAPKKKHLPDQNINYTSMQSTSAISDICAFSYTTMCVIYYKTLDFLFESPVYCVKFLESRDKSRGLYKSTCPLIESVLWHPWICM